MRAGTTANHLQVSALAGHPRRTLLPGSPAPLPEPLTSLIGREQDIVALLALLDAHSARLITLLGPGGVGKTRLALSVAEQVAGAGGCKVHFVPLAPITNPSLVISAIAVSLGVDGVDQRPMLERVAEAIGETETLLVLDNFERLVDAGSTLPELLGACPGLKFLITSRARLRLSAEQVFEVGPLKAPDASASIQQIGDAPAVRLFVERAQSRWHGSNPTVGDAELRATAEICRKLDGLPLAIELAAARMGVFNARQLLNQLDQGLAILRHGPRDAPARLQSMQDMIAWSYDLLAEDEQAFLRLLSVFSGGFTFRSAAEIFGVFREAGDENFEDSPPDWTGGAGDTRVADLLLSLIDQSLIQQGAADDGSPRFTLLETIREFGRGRLAASGETERAFRLHAEWFAALARSRRPYLISMPKSAKHDPLFGEHDNVRAAIEWSIHHLEMNLAGWLVCGLWPYCYQNGLQAEARDVFERTLSAPGALRPDLHADLLHNASLNAIVLGDLERAQSMASEGLFLFESLNNPNGVAHCLCLIGKCLTRTEPDRAAANWSRAAEIFRSIHESSIPVAYAICGLGNALMHAGSLPAAKTAFTESAVGIDRAGCGPAASSPYLGWIAVAEGDLDLAYRILSESLKAGPCEPTAHDRSHILRLLGRVEFQRGTLRTAADHYHQALSISREISVLFESVQCIAEMAAVAQADREPELAARWLAFDERYRQDRRLVLSPDEASLRMTASEHARAALGDENFAAAWEAGTLLSLDEACEGALAWQLSERAESRPASGLTRREAEVLDLLAGHHTNQEIADQLFLGVRTVETHVANVLAKLGAASRREAVTIAKDRNLLEV